MAFVDDNSAAFGLLLSHQTDLVARYNRASWIRDWVLYDDRGRERGAEKERNDDVSDPTIPTIEDKARWIS